MWSHKKKFIGVTSGDLGGQAIGPSRPIQRSFKWRWDVESEEDLISFIVEAAPTIRQQPGTVERTRQSLLLRCRLCMDVDGRAFEHLF